LKSKRIFRDAWLGGSGFILIFFPSRTEPARKNQKALSAEQKPIFKGGGNGK
jgi:hypothetical protein